MQDREPYVGRSGGAENFHEAIGPRLFLAAGDVAKAQRPYTAIELLRCKHSEGADLANEVLTTAMETWDRLWTRASIRRVGELTTPPAVDLLGPAKPPEKRKVGGSTPPLTTTTHLQKTVPHLRKRSEAPFFVLRLPMAVHG